MITRKSVRLALASALSGKTSAGTNVLTSRYTAIFSDAFPLILVYVPEEESNNLDAAATEYIRKATAMISAVIKADDSIDDSLDDMADSIQSAFASDPSLGGLVSSIILQKVNSDIETSGESQFGAVHMTYEVIYVA